MLRFQKGIKSAEPFKTPKRPPLTNAERQRLFRLRVKEDPIKDAEYRQKLKIRNKEKYEKYRKKVGQKKKVKSPKSVKDEEHEDYRIPQLSTEQNTGLTLPLSSDDSRSSKTLGTLTLVPKMEPDEAFDKSSGTSPKRWKIVPM